ncbi:hypothetical protein B484DRAFT_245220 [Ochromonadaceae sp. CCMP2298]|nr:hypothetical protein B484DRAFT_245220 [Ochromonadaceae sp. CCMP2298]
MVYALWSMVYGYLIRTLLRRKRTERLYRGERITRREVYLRALLLAAKETSTEEQMERNAAAFPWDDTAQVIEEEGEKEGEKEGEEEGYFKMSAEEEGKRGKKRGEVPRARSPRPPPPKRQKVDSVGVAGKRCKLCNPLLYYYVYLTPSFYTIMCI